MFWGESRLSSPSHRLSRLSTLLYPVHHYSMLGDNKGLHPECHACKNANNLSNAGKAKNTVLS